MRLGWGWAYGEVRAAVHLEVVEQLAQRERVVRVFVEDATRKRAHLSMGGGGDDAESVAPEVVE